MTSASDLFWDEDPLPVPASALYPYVAPVKHVSPKVARAGESAANLSPRHPRWVKGSNWLASLQKGGKR